MVIAIDGPGGVGKSTVARRVAEILGFEYLDTGAFYRAATLAVLEEGLEPGDEAAVTELVASLDLRYDDGAMYVGDRDVTGDIRSEAVTAAVSVVAAIPEVRRVIVAAQQAWLEADAVVEGRDIGTVVFPGAEVKVFLDAPPDVRAQRRAGDREAAGKSVDRVEEELRRRDRIDSSRTASPLRVAPDADVIDTGTSSIDEVVARVLELYWAATAG